MGRRRRRRGLEWVGEVEEGGWSGSKKKEKGVRVGWRRRRRGLEWVVEGNWV